MIWVSPEAIVPADLLASVADPAAGAVDLFLGTVRNHSDGREVRCLHYEAYQEMAEAELARIVEDARRRWQVRKLSVVHRTGHLAIGEASVGIAVSAEHRAEAFDACRWIIEQIKESVPIWKKEIYPDGEAWVGTGKSMDVSEPLPASALASSSERPCPS